MTDDTSAWTSAPHEIEDEAGERIVVWPHRSMDRRGCTVLLGAVGAVFLVIVIWAVAQGAWPTAVYAGLALAGFAVALSCNRRSARALEVIELSPGNIRVCREGHAQERRETLDFNPRWVQVVEAHGPWDDKRLLLRQSGRWIEIGAFLTVDERCELAAELRRKIAQRYALP